MNLRIWKYYLEIIELQTLQMPIGAKILTAQVQNNELFLWALGDTDAKTEKRKIEVIGTGNPMDNKNRSYIGTAQTHGGALVWHVFEVAV